MTITNKDKHSFSLELIRSLEAAVKAKKEDAELLSWLSIRKGKIQFDNTIPLVDVDGFRKALIYTIDDRYVIGVCLDGIVTDVEEIVNNNGERKRLEYKDIESLIQENVYPTMEEEYAFLASERAFWNKRPWEQMDFLNASEALDVIKTLRKQCITIYLPA